jgi:hypothetical protein
MVYNCRRCRRPKWHGELRNGSKTGSHAVGYRKLVKEINTSGIVKIEKGIVRDVLCPRCLKELNEWIKVEGGPHRLPALAGVQVKEKSR